MHDESLTSLPSAQSRPLPDERRADALGPLDIALPIVTYRRLLVIASLVVGLLALGWTYLKPPIFTAKTTFLPPQQQQNAAASALAALGSVAGLAGLGGSAGVKTTADQYIALMQSSKVVDRLIDQFDLMKVYETKSRFDARKNFAGTVRITIGRKDGLIMIEVDDTSPARAAAIANRHVDELRRVTGELALTEAQQRRVFFEEQLGQTRDRLTKAQLELQASGFTQGALRAEPRAAAEGYARLKAEATAAEVRLQTLRRTLSDATPEVQQQLSTLAALRAQLARAEEAHQPNDGPDYVGKYREFKYQETLFDLFARQYELARLDESREGALIQVVDPAEPPERKSRPKRAITAIIATLATFVALSIFVIARHLWRESASDPKVAEKMRRLRAARARR